MKRTVSVILCVMIALFATPCAYAEGSIFDFLNGASNTRSADMAKYYLDEMYAAALAGDVSAGRTAEENRNHVIAVTGSKSQCFSFDDLYLLSRFIFAEAGSDWLSDDFRMKTGEVVMNRVASPEFPDTLSGVLYQKGQYSAVTASGFEYIVPTEECVNAAFRLLQGERQMVPSVVYQANYIQGDVFYMYTDRRLGSTFFCVSENIELYQ